MLVQIESISQGQGPEPTRAWFVRLEWAEAVVTIYQVQELVYASHLVCVANGLSRC